MKTATIERFNFFGTPRYALRVTYRGWPLTWSEGRGITAMAQAEHIGAETEDAMRQHAKRHGFTHCRFVGDWSNRTKPRGGKL